MARLCESNGRRVPQTAVCVPVGRTCATRRTVGGCRDGGSCLLVGLPWDARVIYAARMEHFELGLRARWIGRIGRRWSRCGHVRGSMRRESGSWRWCGEPCVRGMRITVRRVPEILASGRDRDEILREYPFLEEEGLNQVARTIHGFRRGVRVGACSWTKGNLDQIGAGQWVTRF